MQHDSDKKKPCVHTYIITRLSGLTKLCDCDCCISHTIHRVRECVLNIIAKIKFVLIVNVNYECKNRMCFKYYKDISLSLQCLLHLKRLRMAERFFKAQVLTDVDNLTIIVSEAMVTSLARITSGR